MAYLTCPDCMMPNPVGDEAIAYRCFACFSEVVFETCRACGYQQSIPARWVAAFACGKCGEKVGIPYRRLYSTSTKARWVQGYGYLYPRV
jgi:hypothetical protein